MNNKYEFTGETKVEFGTTLHRIRALVKIGLSVKAGDVGGWIEKEENLDVSGNAWVSENAQVYGDARVSGNAWVSGNAQVSENAQVYGDARVYGDAWVSGNARVYGNAQVYGDARVYGDAWVSGNAQVSGNARVCGDAQVYGNAQVNQMSDIACVVGFGSEFRHTTFFRCRDKQIRVVCGCFFGTIAEFRCKVKETHGDNKYAKEYLAIADLMEMHFADNDEEEE